MENNLAATVFVYKHRVDETIRCEYIDGAMVMGDEWVHLATLEPRLFIQAHWKDIEEIEYKRNACPDCELLYCECDEYE